MNNPYEYSLQRSWEEKDRQQNAKINKMVNAIKDFSEASREIELEYREKACEAISKEISRQLFINFVVASRCSNCSYR